MKNLILAAQNETIRILPGEHVTAGTIDVDVCHVEILRADNGRISLTHVDRLTDPQFVRQELKWLRNDDENMPVHRITVRTKQSGEKRDRMNERLAKFDQAIGDIQFASTKQEIVPLDEIEGAPTIIYSIRSGEMTATATNKLAKLDPDNKKQILQAQIRMREYIFNCFFTGKNERNLITPPVVYQGGKWIDSFSPLESIPKQYMDELVKHHQAIQTEWAKPFSSKQSTDIEKLTKKLEQRIKHILEKEIQNGPYSYGGSPVWYIKGLLEGLYNKRRELTELQASKIVGRT